MNGERLKARREGGIVDGETFAGLRQRIIIKACGMIGLQAWRERAHAWAVAGEDV